MKLKPLVKNKKGNIMFILIFVIALFAVLIIGFIAVIGSSIINFAFDEMVPELSNLGMVGDANLTQIAGFTLAPLNLIVQNFTWLAGVLYALILISSIGIVFAIKVTPSKWLIGFYFMLIFLLIVGSIFMSNIYEDFYNDTDGIGPILKEHILLSWLVLYSPMVFSILAFITGVILFSGMQEEFV